MTNLRIQVDEYAADLEPTVTESGARASFDDPSDELLWIAVLICGDPIKAQLASVGVHGSLVTGNEVCIDWAAQSNTRATARIAIEEVRNSVSKSAQHYSNPSLSTNSLDPLNEQQMNTLLCVPVERVIVDLDPLARCVLALRGVLKHSIEDCVYLAQAGRDQIVAAYDRALGWLAYQQRDSFWNDIRWDVNVFPVHHDDDNFLGAD